MRGKGPFTEMGSGVHGIEADVLRTLDMLTWRSGERPGFSSAAKVAESWNNSRRSLFCSLKCKVWCSQESHGAGALYSWVNSGPAAY